MKAIEQLNKVVDYWEMIQEIMNYGQPFYDWQCDQIQRTIEIIIRAEELRLKADKCPTKFYHISVMTNHLKYTQKGDARWIFKAIRELR